MSNQKDTSIRILQYLWASIWVTCSVVLLLGECGALENADGMFVGKDEICYALQLAEIILTIVGVPMSLKWLHWNGVRRRILQASDPRQEYFKQFTIALSLLDAPALLGVLGYYLMLDTSMLCCTAVVAISLLLLWPTQEKRDDYLEKGREEKEEAV
ncbi:MAG: hypothetical protein HUK02_10250 [Bacteroidaceae bacterium]|nr:hypothetical protein [Bacteroidaceae bacterium]